MFTTKSNVHSFLLLYYFIFTIVFNKTEIDIQPSYYKLIINDILQNRRMLIVTKVYFGISNQYPQNSTCMRLRYFLPLISYLVIFSIVIIYKILQIMAESILRYLDICLRTKNTSKLSGLASVPIDKKKSISNKSSMIDGSLSILLCSMRVLI